MRPLNVLSWLALCAALLGPLPAVSSVVLVEDVRSLDGFASVGTTPVSHQSTLTGPGDFSAWANSASVTAVDYTCNGLCYGQSSGYQYSGASPTLIYGHVDAGCLLVTGFGSLHAGAWHTTGFTAVTCQQYQLIDSTEVKTGGLGSVKVSLQPMNGFAPTLIDLGDAPKNISMGGRLPPGDYIFSVSTSTGDQTATVHAPQIFYSISFADCLSSLISAQPASVVASPGAAAQFFVEASAPTKPSGSAPATGVTYRWQKDLEDLADGGRISGATTATLTISGVQAGDAGVYNAVLSDGTVSEPSSYVTLTLGASTGVPSGDPKESGFALSAPGPNPFSAETAMRYSLAADSPVRLEIFDVHGRRVRTLVDRSRVPAGTYEARWNGDDDSGARSPAGVYFLRWEAGGHRESRRVVHMQTGRN